MGYSQHTHQRIDAVIGARLLNTCWFVTGVGISIAQMRLIAQDWYQGHLALWAACVASAWLVGSVFSAILLSSRRHTAVRLWGCGFLACTLLWLYVPMTPRFLPANIILSTGEFALIAFLLGLMSTAWLLQRRPWPPVGERTALAKGALAMLVGLGAVWLFPNFSGALEIACLSPLLLLDFWPQSQAPLPAPGRMIDNWYDTNEGADRWRLQLNRGKLFRRWWWAYLARRGRLSLILLASAISIILGSVWSALPTPFAGDLLAGGQIWTLAWLIASQAIALCLGLSCFFFFRGALGPQGRLIPQEWRLHAWATAFLMLVLMACALLTLGLPFLQTPWWLALSIALYTCAGTIWGILLPRLRPSLGTVIFSQRHLLLRQGSNPQIGKGQLAYERAQEEYVNRIFFTGEAILTALTAPLVGWLVDRWSVDAVLVASGRFLLVFVVLSVAIIGLLRVIRYKPLQGTRQQSRYTTGELHWERIDENRTSAMASLQEKIGPVEDVSMSMYQRYYE
ncbi:MAG: hypothetical protein H0W02_05575 [Ktedonobacteraceae bacterium]|nr:hypothetical protein [Ktedonobacteraceae bacterium]